MHCSDNSAIVFYGHLRNEKMHFVIRNQRFFNQKIAEEHAAIAAQRETERLAYEATSIVNDVNLDHAY